MERRIGDRVRLSHSDRTGRVVGSGCITRPDGRLVQQWIVELDVGFYAPGVEDCYIAVILVHDSSVEVA